MKFLVLWHFELNRLGPEVIRAVTQMPDYAKKLGDKLECRYHVIGSHGGAWIYDVTSNEELDRLLAMSPVYNYAIYQVLALAEMEDPRTVFGRPISRGSTQSACTSRTKQIIPVAEREKPLQGCGQCVLSMRVWPAPAI